MLRTKNFIIFTIMAFFLAGNTLAQNAFYNAPSQEDVETGNLTDREKVMMDNYTHAGYQKREADEEWSKECGDSDYCDNIRNGGDAIEGKKFLGMSPRLFKAVAQAYSMIMPAISQSGNSMLGKIDRTTKADVSNTWAERGMTKNQDGSFSVTNQQSFDEWNQSQPEHKRFGADGTRVKTKPKIQNLEDGRTKVTHEPVLDENGNEVMESREEVAQQEEQKAEEKEGEDYCQYIPMGTEMIARSTQKRSDDFALKTEPKLENAQSGALFKQARSHRDRQKSVDIQRKGWGATTVCYLASMGYGGVGSFKSPTNLLKLGAATLMTKYYMWEYDHHGDAADKLTSVGKRLSGKGKCNPISDRDCYCSEPETQNDVTYCYPQIAGRKSQNENFQVTCVNNNVKEDIGCTCRQTNTCLDSRISTKIAGMHIPGGLGSSLEDFYKMTNGVSTPANSSDTFKSTAGKIFAIANDKFKENIDKVNLPKSFDKKDQELAKSLRSLGLDGTIANVMSAAPETKESKQAEKALKSRFARTGKPLKKYASYKPNKNNGLYFKGGNGLNKKKRQEKKKTNPFAHLLKRKKKTNARTTADILDYSRKAQKNAGITKDKSRNIFEIISRRYRYSATKKLGIQ